MVRLTRRRFLQGMGAAAAASPLLLTGDPAVATSWSKKPPPKPVMGKGSRDQAAERHGGPLELPAWSHGNQSAAADTVLMFRGNPSHTFYGTGPLPDKAPEILWKHRMIDFATKYYGEPFTWRGTGWTGQAVAYGGYIFIGSQGANYYAFEAATGKLRWRYKSQRQFKASSCFYDNKIYIGSVDNWLRCIDAATGDVIWRVWADRDLDSSACVTDGKLYIAGESGFARCLDPQSGEHLWRTWVGGMGTDGKGGSHGSETSPAVADGEYYTATYTGDLFCLDAKTGAKRWKANTHDDTDASPVIWDDFVYTAAEDKSPHVYCFARKDGREIWRARNRKGFWSTPAVVDGVLYIGGFDGKLYAIDAKSGKERWTTAIGSPTWSSPVVIGDKLIIGAFDGRLRCFSTSGKKIWEKKLLDRMHSTACVVDGKIYVGTRGGWFYALG